MSGPGPETISGRGADTTPGRLPRAGAAASLANLGLVFYTMLSDNLLVTMGIPYNTPHGNIIAKIHPGTWVTVLAFFWLVSKGNPLGNLATLARRTPSVATLAVVSLAALVISLALYGPSGSAFVIDTWIGPCMLGLVLREAEPEQVKRIFILYVAMIAGNAVLGLVEAGMKYHTVPYLAGDVPIIEEHFRATALGGHPLSNAARTATVLCAVFALDKVRNLALLVPLLALSLLAFGSRSALVIALGVLGGWGMARFLAGMLSRRGGTAQGITVLLGVAALPVAAWWFDLGKRILDTFYWDESAQSRLLVFKVFDHVDTYDLWMGIGPASIQTILDRLKGSTSLTDLENFWILLLLQFGLVIFVPLTFSFLWTIYSLARDGGMPTRLAALVFLLLASSNNSLATKTQTLALVMPVLIGSAVLRPRSPAVVRRRGPAAPARYHATLFRLPADQPTTMPPPPPRATLFRLPPGGTPMDQA